MAIIWFSSDSGIQYSISIFINFCMQESSWLWNKWIALYSGVLFVRLPINSVSSDSVLFHKKKKLSIVVILTVKGWNICKIRVCMKLLNFTRENVGVCRCVCCAQPIWRQLIPLNITFFRFNMRYRNLIIFLVALGLVVWLLSVSFTEYVCVKCLCIQCG